MLIRGQSCIGELCPNADIFFYPPLSPLDLHIIHTTPYSTHQHHHNYINAQQPSFNPIPLRSLLSRITDVPSITSPSTFHRHWPAKLRAHLQSRDVTLRCPRVHETQEQGFMRAESTWRCSKKLHHSFQAANLHSHGYHHVPVSAVEPWVRLAQTNTS